MRLSSCSSLILLIVTACVRLSRCHTHHRHQHDFQKESDGTNSVSGVRSSSASFACGTEDPEDLDLLEMNLMQEAWEYNHNVTAEAGHSVFDENHKNRLLVAAQHRKYTIPVFFSVLARSDGVGKMKKEGLEKYIRVLNQAYKNTNFQFELQGAQRRNGDQWHNCAYEDRQKWMSRLRVGGTNALNIYICRPYFKAQRAEDLYGFSSWPTNANQSFDGVAVPHGYYYGNLASRYFLTHEVGHFLGLLHTFSNGCSSRPRVFEDMPISDGDGVQDTAAHAFPTWDNDDGLSTCWQNSQLDTCNDTLPEIDPGLDPVSNYMNYVDPICWARFGEFTVGQKRRMLAIFEQFRLSNIWQCSQPMRTCRRHFECCDPDNYSCIKSSGRKRGKCTKRCAKSGNTCRQASDCCDNLGCNSGTCSMPMIKQAFNTDNDDDDNTETDGNAFTGCRSLLCRRSNGKIKRIKSAKAVMAKGRARSATHIKGRLR